MTFIVFPLTPLGITLAALFVGKGLILSRAGRSAEDNDGLDHLRDAIPGDPGVDYPIHSFDDLHRNFNSKDLNPKVQLNRNSRNDFESNVANGGIPGIPGKDYPVNSLANLRSKHKGIQLAPPELITPSFPLNTINNPNKPLRRIPSRQGNRAVFSQSPGRSGRPKPRPTVPAPRRTPTISSRNNIPTIPTRRNTQEIRAANPTPPLVINDKIQQQSSNVKQSKIIGALLPTVSDQEEPEEPIVFNGNYCPGNSLQHCINFCPREESLFQQCQLECENAC